ncbi:MAG TPA: hypothetical protein PLD37_09850 [Usitatibacteraceae bacterium]|nr:hypothetical protein [Usitatibacteraceae bacterium]
MGQTFDATRDISGDTRVMHILYLLHGLAPFTMWLLAIVAVIVGFAKRGDVEGTILASHVSWLSRTFWWGLLWIAICGVITFVLVITIVGALIAWLPYTLLFLWYLYRVIKGWLALNDGKAVA